MSSVAAQQRHWAFTQAALASAPLGIAFIDTALRVLWANDAFAALSGQTAAAHVGRRLSELLPVGTPAIEHLVREVLQGGTPLSGVPLDASPEGPASATAAHDTAASRHWHASIRAVHADSGELLGACLICTDVTDVRTLAGQFLQSQKMEAVGLLANVIAHDFNNLLTVIQGYSELLLRNSTDEAKRTKRLSEIRTAAEAAGHLSRQLLTLSRRNTGAVAPVDINLLVRGIGRVLDRLLPANVAHDLVLAEDVGLTLADPGQVEQIVMNLLTNAIDAMPSGGLLTIETSNTEHDAARDGLPPGSYVTLTVTDTGEGMDAVTQARIWDPHFTTKTAARGTGLGLSAVRTMITALHGGLSCVSAPGKGSTFTIRLPRITKQGVDSGASPPIPPGARVATILVVEDHDGVRHTLTTMLEEAGYMVLAVSAGSEALHVAAAHAGPIDLLLADVELPDAAGNDLAERLRRARPGIHVLISSGFGEQKLSLDDAKRGDYTIIAKPFAMHDLLNTIQSILYPTPPAVPAAV